MQAQLLIFICWAGDYLFFECCPGRNSISAEKFVRFASGSSDAFALVTTVLNSMATEELVRSNSPLFNQLTARAV